MGICLLNKAGIGHCSAERRVCSVQSDVHVWTCLADACDGCEQAAALKAQIKQRQRRGEVKTDTQGNITDKTTRLLQGHINNLERPVKADEQEQAALLAREHTFRATAMRAYRRQANP